jgi:type II secretory pathway predicted ATPase ExeA
MYETHYGLTRQPFSLLPDPDCLLLGRNHKIAYLILQNALLNSEAFTVLTGEIGCGKTTLIRHLMRSVGPQITFGLISDTVRLRGEILERVLLAFGLDVSTGGWTEKFNRFTKFTLEQYAQGKRVVVIVDEAQNLDHKALEELRVLSNINAEKDLLVQIILTGQPELRQKLLDPRLEQFAQRISKLYHLLPLNESGTREYIRHRLSIAGGKPELFSDEACDQVYRESRGIPRIINQLCDMALTYAFGLEKDHVDGPVMELVITDREAAWTVSPTPVHTGHEEPDVAPSLAEEPSVGNKYRAASGPARKRFSVIERHYTGMDKQDDGE